MHRVIASLHFVPTSVIHTLKELYTLYRTFVKTLARTSIAL